MDENEFDSDSDEVEQGFLWDVNTRDRIDDCYATSKHKNILQFLLSVKGIPLEKDMEKLSIAENVYSIVFYFSFTLFYLPDY